MVIQAVKRQLRSVITFHYYSRWQFLTASIQSIINNWILRLFLTCYRTMLNLTVWYWTWCGKIYSYMSHKISCNLQIQLFAFVFLLLGFLSAQSASVSIWDQRSVWLFRQATLVWCWDLLCWPDNCDAHWGPGMCMALFNVVITVWCWCWYW